MRKILFKPSDCIDCKLGNFKKLPSFCGKGTYYLLLFRKCANQNGRHQKLQITRSIRVHTRNYGTSIMWFLTCTVAGKSISIQLMDVQSIDDNDCKCSDRPTQTNTSMMYSRIVLFTYKGSLLLIP